MATLVPLFEMAVIGLLCAVSWRILAATPQRNAVGLAILLGSLAAGTAGAAIAWAIAGLFGSGSLKRLAVWVAASPVFFVAASILLTAGARRRDLSGRLARRFPLGVLTARLLNGGAVAALWLAVLVAAVGWATLAGVSPLRRTIEEHSLLFKHLLPTPPPQGAAGPGRSASGEEGAGGLGSALPDPRPAPAGQSVEPLPSLQAVSGPMGFLARLTGAVELANWLLCAQDVAQLAKDLDDPERLLALRRLPALQRLAGNASLRALVEDAQVRLLAAKCLAGDAAAMARLAENPRITALLSDEGFRREVRTLDVWSLRHELAQVRLPTTRLQPDPWHLAVLNEGESLAGCAGDVRRWRSAGSSCVLVWPAGTQRGAASGHLRTAEPMRLVIYLDRNVPAALQINGETVELTVGTRGQLAIAQIPAGESVIALEVTLSGPGRPRAVSVELFAEPVVNGNHGLR